MRCLSIDYGKIRVGIALSDETNTIATSQNTIANDKSLIPKIKNFITRYSITHLIFGYPLKLSGEKSDLCLEIDNFIENFNDKNIKLIKIDERFSSKISEFQIRESINSRMKRRDKSLIDKFSAANILQEFLNSKKW